MNLAIFEAFECGMAQITCVLIVIGALAQYLMLKFTKRTVWKWIFPVLNAAATLALEICCQLTTGWDLLAWLLFYCIALWLLVGNVIAALVYRIRHRGA